MVHEGDHQTDGNASFLRAARSGNLEKVIEHLKGNIDINTSNANGLNALHLAAKEGHVVVVTELLKRGANVNAATKKGNTALHIASLAGQEEVVRVLIQLGANVNVQSQNGFTPLYMAAQENHDHVVSFLLANGANQSLATEDGFAPLAVALQQGHDRVVAVLLENDTKGRVRLPALHIAAKKDDCKAATLLLQSDHNPDVTSKSGFTPLHIAAHYGNENIAKILLSKGADVNYAAKHQITPLHVASKWGKTNMVVLLLEKGANIEASTRDGLTPLHCASRSGHEQVVDLLLEKGAPFLAKTKNGLAPLHMASQGDHVDSARILLYHKAPVDDVTVDYLTALHVAAHCGHVKVAKLLLDRKADPNARALNGFTPLHIACKKNRIKVVELLLKHGASIEATTESGLTPLHVASFMGCMNIVIYLIQNGAHPDVPTVRGETPLHLAARANQTDIIRILLRNGASVDARAREEQTPLHIAARLGNVDIVSLLLQHGAAVDAVTKDMYTALHIAAKEDQEEVASALLDHGASLTSTTKKGFTPLHLAAKYGNIKVARLLLQRGAPVDAQGKNGVTPLHVAAHYDHVNVALLLLDKGASPHAMAKNGYTPLHIAAKKNQMDIASTLLEYGAKTNSESKAGFTPLHLSSQEGHAEMSALLIEHKADVNHRANNGLTPLHLCAQDDRVSVASILTKNGAEVCPKTKAGYTPLHVAAHFGQINMVRFLLQNEASVHNTTSHGYTPLHQAAQQGHTLVVNLLLENQASPNVTTMQGQTPLSIAQRLGYISVVETLKVVTETTVITTTTTVTEEKYKVVAPETMQETFMTDSEDEGGEEAMLGDQSYRYLTADEMKSLGDDSLPIDVTKDEKHHDVMQSVKQFGAPMVEEDNLSPQHVTPVESGFSEKYSPDNVDLARAPVHAGRLKWKTFLVSFMVDARGGAMRGCRHSGVRVIIPPRKAAMPMRITCRYLRKEKLIHPPPLMEGEACASRILEMGPVSAKFLGPVIIEVPHFASTRGKEREIIILRSDTGESWREHTLEASEEAVQEVLNESFEGEELSALEDLNTNRITRILTTDFPQYFAIVCRVRQESHGVGPEGGMVSSTVVPQVQAIFPEGALTKKIRVGLQAQPIAPELVAKLLGNRVAVSPIVTVEPRRRKFHKPITLTIPVPQAVTKGMINQYSGEAPTLRLLCSITGSTKSGGSSKAQWEDVTGSTPLTFVNDCVSFTTTVSARFWLMDCRQVNEVTRFATELYQEAVYVPFMSKFVIFAKRNDPYEAQLRVFCMTDDKEDKTLESQEHFTEVAKSRDVEVLEGKTEYLEFAGNLVPVTKSGEQLKFTFQAFHENRLPFTIRVKDPHAEPMGRIAFMREPRAGRGEPPQVPICNLNVALPDITLSESSPDVLELVTLEKRYDFIQEAGLSKPELIHRADLRLSDIARELDKDWISLAQQLDLSEGDIEQLKSETAGEPPEQALIMLRMWLQKSGPKATGNELEKALRRINREDIINHCMFNVELVTDDVEKAVAKVHLDQSGFDVFKEELGSSREASMRRGASLDISYDEQDIMKEAESAAETSSETGSLFEREHIPHSLTDDKDGKIRRASKTPPPSPVDEEVIQDKRADTLKDISPSALVFHIKEDTFKKQVDTTGEANMPPVAQELVARLTESETWPSGDLDTSQVSVSSLPDDEKSESNTAVFETTVVSTKETISTLGASDTFIPATTEILQTHAEQDNVEKTEVDGSGSTTHIIQKTTHMTIVGKIPDEVLAGEGDLRTETFQAEAESPESPELSFAEKRDFFQKLSLSSSSPSVTPTHTAKSSVETEIRLETIITEDNAFSTESPEEHLSFVDRLKFFEKSSEDQTPAPEVKEIKRETWTIVASEKKDEDSEIVHDSEKEREVETIEVQTISEVIFRDTQVSLPLYESKEVLETIDSNKDTKVEVIVKTFSPGSEQVEICAVENIPKSDASEVQESNAVTSNKRFSQESLALEADAKTKAGDEARVSESSVPGVSTASEQAEKIISDEEFLSRTLKSFTESSYEVSKNKIDAFKKEAGDKGDNKWQRESPDNISIVKETMEPSLGKSEIFICTEETLDSVKKILSVAEAESNVVLNESEPSSSDVPQEQDKKIESKDEIFTKVETKLLESQRLSDNESMKEIEQIEPNSQEKEIVKTSAEKQRSDQYSVTQEEKIKTTSLDTSQRTKYILSEDIVADSICDTYDDRSNVDGSKNAVLEKMSSETVEKSVILDQSVVRSQENVQDILPDSNVDTLDKTVVFKDQDSVKLEELRAKIEKERENGIHFEETLSRSVGSNESCFSSSKDHSVEIEFLPVLEVSDDVSKVSVDKTGHEALGTPCSFHKEMTIEGQHLDLEKSFEERQSGSFDKKIPLTAAVEKAEYEEREKHTKENLEEMIYRESKGGETSDKETLECVEVTQFKEHSTEVYNLPSQKLMEKFSSKKLLIEASSEEVKIMPTQKLNQFLDSVTQIEDDTGAYSLPSDLAPVHKRTEEWLDQSGEIMLKEGSLIDVAEIGLFEDRVPTLEDEQHKRSSPTAESFDDKARVEQCDTDVMMQLLDFVSRNDVELSEVRTEDEAPDIEEDVSPSTEEEICTSVTYDNKVETETKELVHSEEKTRDCLKVAETENLLLSPLRSSFDSVTSPSRKDFSSEIVDTVMESKPFIEKTDIGAATCSRQIIPQSSLEVEVGSHGSDEIGVHDNEKEMTPLSYVEEEEHSKIEFEGVEDGKPWATKNIKCEDQALKSGIVLEEHSQPSHEQLIPADQKDAEPKITTVELTTTKQIEEAMPVKDSQALRTEIVEETAADTSKDVVEESSKEEVIQSKETSSVAQVIPTERKMTEEITSTECQSSTSAQIYEVREEGFSKTEPSQEHVLKASESTDEDLVVGMEESSFVKKEIISDSTVVKQFVPCAFDNTAFAGADFIDEVEQAVPVRARSPYEVIREDQGEVPALGIGQTLNENVIKEVSGSVSKIDFMPKQMDIRRRPILQHIPSEISEEDLVEREIISPVTKEFEVFEEADIKGQGPLGTEFSHSVIGTAAEISSSIDDDKQSDFNKGNGSESPIISENIIHSDSNEIPSPHSVHHISSHTERDADESKIKKQVENLRSPPNSLPIKRDLIESVIKTDEGTTPESDTGLPTSPFELISGSEISDEEHKTGLPSSITLMKSDQEDRSQDSVITTTQSQSYTESTFSASIRTSSKDLSDSCTHNEGLQFQSSKTTRTGITTFTKTLKDTSDEYMQEMDKQLLNGPGEVEYRPEYDDDHEYRPEERLSGFETMRVSEGSANDAFESDDYKKSRYSSVSDDVIDSEIGEICNSDQVLEDIIERPVTPEPPKDDERDLIIETHVKREFHSSRSETLDFKREEFLPSTADEQLILSPLGSPDELKPGFAYGMQFEKEILDPTEEAMDIDSDQYSEEKEPPYAYGMRFERDPDLEEDEIPCYGDLYTHEEEDEDALENGEKPKSFQKQVKEADFDILAGRKYFSKNVEFDDLSMSSLQEFERLEAEIVSGRKSSIGSLDSLNGKNHTSKSGEHDDVSMSSLTEFERIERECTETEKIDPAMQESITQLSEIEEGHESQASEASHGKSDEAKEDLSILDDQDLKLQDIDEMILDPPGIAPEEQPYQYIIQKSHTTAKGVSSSILKKESTDYAGAQDAAENQIEIRKMTTIKHVSDTRQKSVETYSNDSVKEDDMDQDSLRDEFSLKPDSLIDDGNKDFQDSLHEDKLDDADSLQGDIPDEMRDSLFEEKQIEDDSLHEMDILPDESSLSLESSLAAALSHDSSKADDRKRYSFDGESDALRLNLRDIVTSSDKAEVVVTDYMRGDVMVSSTDSLEQSRSAAFAAFQMESESAMSSSLNSAITSEDYTMFSSTDTLEHEGRITFRYEDIPVDDLETLIRDGKKVFVDSEGNIQAQYNVKHILEAEDNINSLCSREKTEVELPSSTTVHVHSAVTSVKYADDRTKMSAPIPFSTTTGVKTEDISYESSDFDPNVEVEEVHTTDEFGNPKIIRKVKRFVHTKTQFSSSSSPKDVEEKLKEFLRKNAAGEGAGMGEEEIKEEKTTDAKGNVVLIRTVQQQMLSEPQVHSKTFMGPDADTLSQDFVETFKTLDPTENVCEYEKIDDQGNVVRVTQQVIIKPEVHSISFSGPNARQQMEDYMKQWTATSQSADEYEAGKTSTFFTADELHRFSEQSQQHGVSESSIHSCVEEPSESKVFASQSSERVTVQADAAQASSSGKEETHETRVEEPQQ